MRESPLSAWTIVTFLIGTLVGTGGFWEWKKIELESQNQEIERAAKKQRICEKRKTRITSPLLKTSSHSSKDASPGIFQ